MNKLQIESEALADFYDKINHLETLLNENIQDMIKIADGSESSPKYLFSLILYRKLLMEARAIIRDNAKP